MAMPSLSNWLRLLLDCIVGSTCPEVKGMCVSHYLLALIIYLWGDKGSAIVFLTWWFQFVKLCNTLPQKSWRFFFVFPESRELSIGSFRFLFCFLKAFSLFPFIVFRFILIGGPCELCKFNLTWSFSFFFSVQIGQPIYPFLLTPEQRLRHFFN